MRRFFGVGFLSCLFLLFLGLKLGHVISWSWWFIFMPLYAPLVFGLLVVVFLLVFTSNSVKRFGRWLR